MRKHAEYIIAWANGAEIEYRQRGSTSWIHTEQPMWDSTTEYRIRPEPEMTHFEKYTLYCDVNEHRYDKLKHIVNIHPAYEEVGEVLIRFVNNKPVEAIKSSVSDIIKVIL